MHGWFDEGGPGEPTARHAVGDHSPKCADGRHFQCAGWWWVTKDKIAITCQCPCHEPVRAAAALATRLRRRACS